MTTEGTNEQLENFVKPPVREPEEPSDASKASPAITGETTPEPKPKEEPTMVPVAEVARQRERRREAEAKLAEMEKRMAFLEGRMAAQPPVDPVDPEEQIEQFMDNPIENVDARINEALWQQKVQLTQAQARRVHEDYDEMEKVFLEAVKKSPALGTELRRSADPAEFAYQYAKTHQATSKFKTVDEMRAAWLAEEREKIEAQVRKEIAEGRASTQPPTQAAAPGHGNDTPSPAPPTNLADILPTKEMVT